MTPAKIVHFSTEDIQRAVAVLKSDRLDLWDSLKERELKMKGHDDLDLDIPRALAMHFPNLDRINILRLAFEVRVEARREASLPV